MSANDDQIAQAERRFGVRFPEDYQRFLAAEGSIARFVPPAGDFLMINAVEELIAVNVDTSGLRSAKVVTEVMPADPFWESEHLPDGYARPFVRANWWLAKRTQA
ncbi:SMI1/KNR4 family protein [Streptomyces sp. NPDC051920]|uniref:SMI1/KNR4 family protein n=1 Tax=Streptomyces sp. NPDC051920 TaxID=3155523 RepID=UPI00342A7FFB